MGRTLRNLVSEGRKHVGKTLVAGYTALAITLSSCCDPIVPDPPEPPEPDEPTTELFEETQILTETELEEISSVDEDSITFETLVPYSTGDIIVCDISDETPNGLLRKVTSKSYDGKTLYTVPASLEEAIKRTDVHFTTNSSKATIPILSFEQNFEETVLLDFDGDESTTYDQIIANGDLSGSLDLVLDLKIDNGFEKFTFKTIISQDSSWEIRRGSNVPSLDYEFDILKRKFPSFVIGYIPTLIGPFPITVTPSLDLCAGVKGKLPEEITLLQWANLTAGLSYEKDIGWDIINESYGFWDCFPRTLADFPDFKIFAGPKLNILVYNVAGPYGEINAYVNKVSTDTDWELRVGSEVNLGARMRIFSWNIVDYSANVLDNYDIRGEGEIEEEEEFLEKILFVSGSDFVVEDSDYSQIYTILSDGSNMQALTNFNVLFRDYEPCWSPDGEKIAFVSKIDGNLEIYTMNLDGSEQIRLTNNFVNDRQPNWSPDGEKIVFSRNNGPSTSYNLCLINADGSDTPEEINIPSFSGINLGSPRWSPDRGKIAFDATETGSNYEIYVINPDGSGVQKLTTASGLDILSSWSPDGEKIAFVSDRDGNREIYVMNSDGSDQTRLTHDNDTTYSTSSVDHDPSWSPDGLRIVFVSGRDGGYYNLYTMSSDGSNIKRIITEEYFQNRYPSFCPVPIPQ